MSEIANRIKELWALYESNPTAEMRERIFSEAEVLAADHSRYIDDALERIEVFSLLRGIDLENETEPGVGRDRVISDRLIRSVYQGLAAHQSAGQNVA